MPSSERELVLTLRCVRDLRYWAETNPRLLARIFQLMEETLRTPFTGTGKPEPLKRMGPDLWSRRNNDEHRLVYRVTQDRIVFRQARHHYD